MILVDLSQIIISNLMVELRGHYNAEINVDILRHMILNSIRKNNVKFRKKYGRMVICCDSNHSWRKDIFPYYKENRKEMREKSELPWPEIFNTITQVQSEISENMPYKVLRVDGAEADDIIATIVLNKNRSEKVLILSGDKDFQQLQTEPNVAQYDPTRKRLFECPNPKSFLFEHILRGDNGDGIPNFLSPPDSLVIKKRQKPVMKKKIPLWKSGELKMSEEQKERFLENRKLIDLRMIPSDISEAILDKYNEDPRGNSTTMWKYFSQHGLKQMMEKKQEFMQ